MHAILAALSVDEVEKRLGKVPGAEKVAANSAAQDATVRYEDTQLKIADVKPAVRQRR